ncbi:MAG: hypothetical protein EP338_13880 [Bacteroidetes bacterium]|nr:MAG: hypothetical protein EP338_13880 [Bacteroidota bacterium]
MKWNLLLLLSLLTISCRENPHPGEKVRSVQEKAEPTDTLHTKLKMEPYDEHPDLPLAKLDGHELKRIKDFFEQESISGMNRFIDRKMGITILYSIGVSPDFVRLDSLYETPKEYANIPFWISENILGNVKGQAVNKIYQSPDTLFECETVYHYGCFEDQKGLKVMSKSIDFLLEIGAVEDYEELRMKMLREERKFYQDLEKRSIRIVLTRKNLPPGKPKTAIFHFTKKNGKLFLTLMDFESYNCSV